MEQAPDGGTDLQLLGILEGQIAGRRLRQHGILLLQQPQQRCQRGVGRKGRLCQLVGNRRQIRLPALGLEACLAATPQYIGLRVGGRAHRRNEHVRIAPIRRRCPSPQPRRPDTHPRRQSHRQHCTAQSRQSVARGGLRPRRSTARSHHGPRRHRLLRVGQKPTQPQPAARLQAGRLQLHQSFHALSPGQRWLELAQKSIGHAQPSAAPLERTGGLRCRNDLLQSSGTTRQRHGKHVGSRYRRMQRQSTRIPCFTDLPHPGIRQRPVPVVEGDRGSEFYPIRRNRQRKRRLRLRCHRRDVRRRR
mmetsp:Transcript_14019/g.29596  ORF Transcript_14019/g.29596 Transcript_14019/m.29596 type:complete len:304 (-) Transcript_14019:2088-2999(-)